MERCRVRDSTLENGRRNGLRQRGDHVLFIRACALDAQTILAAPYPQLSAYAAFIENLEQLFNFGR